MKFSHYVTCRLGFIFDPAEEGIFVDVGLLSLGSELGLLEVALLGYPRRFVFKRVDLLLRGRHLCVAIGGDGCQPVRQVSAACRQLLV